jgi:hypothetical protein
VDQSVKENAQLEFITVEKLYSPKGTLLALGQSGLYFSGPALSAQVTNL